MKMKMNKKQAIIIAGGNLTATSKMPCKSFGIPAQRCGVGSRLHEVKGSVCEGCYALDKGLYRMNTVKNAQEKRFKNLYHPKWVMALTTMIGKEKWFRWHDSGDIHSLIHMSNIMAVAIKTPDCKHWIPTREYEIVTTYVESGMFIPKNVYLRLSAHMVDGKPPTELARRLNAYENVEGFIGTSTVAKKKKASCPAHEQDNQCLECRTCWSRKENVGYKWH